MKARVVEMERAKGWGKVELEDGRLMSFDASVATRGVPDVGVLVEVHLGPSRLGGEKITSLEIEPTWEPETLSFLFLRQLDAQTAELLYVSDKRTVRAREPLATSTGPSMRPGATGRLVLEHKRGSAEFTETRVTRWWPEEIETFARDRLLEAFRESVEEEWCDWDHPDGCHCADHREGLRADVFLAADLGLEVDALLTIKDYPDQGAGSAYEEQRPTLTRTVRLVR